MMKLVPMGKAKVMGKEDAKILLDKEVIFKVV